LFSSDLQDPDSVGQRKVPGFAQQNYLPHRSKEAISEPVEVQGD